MRTVLAVVASVSVVAFAVSGTGRRNGALVSVGAMHDARAAHTATLLRNGLVLIAGGFGSAPTNSAELFDPVTRTFRPTGSMTTARAAHSATLLRDGRVLMSGGLAASGILSTSEYYDPSTGRFSAGPPLSTRLANHVAVRFNDGRLLLIGGTTGSSQDWSFLRSAEIFDPATGRFTATGSMSTPREGHAATLLPNGEVLVTGGHSGRAPHVQIYASAEIYDPRSGRFRAAAPMSHVRHKHEAVLLRDGRVLIAGGADDRDDQGAFRDTEIYDPNSGTFSAGPSMNLTRYKHAGTALTLADGRVLMAGGAAKAELFEPRSGRFQLVDGDARMRGNFSAAALLPGDRALITGGYGGGNGPTNGAWLYER